jgi:hypothetical protein
MSDPLERERRLLWTLVIQGDPSLYLSVTHGPDLSHEGGETVWKALLTPSEMDALEERIVQEGLSVERIRQSRSEIREAESKDWSHIEMSDFDPTQMAYRTRKCPTCFWFHPTTPQQCGLDDWPMEVRTGALAVQKARTDKDVCEIHGGQDVQ